MSCADPMGAPNDGDRHPTEPTWRRFVIDWTPPTGWRWMTCDEADDPEIPEDESCIGCGGGVDCWAWYAPAVPTHRATRRPLISFDAWCQGKGIPTVSEFDLATFIGDAITQSNRTGAQCGKLSALERRLADSEVAFRAYRDDPTAWETVCMPLDLTRASDRAYVRAHHKRAARRTRIER